MDTGSEIEQSSKLVPPSLVRKELLNIGPCFAVAHLPTGNLLIGKSTGVEERDREGTLIHSLKTQGGIHGVCGYMNSVLCLQGIDQRRSVITFDLPWILRSAWSVPEYEFQSSLGVVGDHIIIPDPAHRQILVYRPTGQIVKTITNPSFIRPSRACALGDDSVLISDPGAEKVFRVSFQDGTVLWEYGGSTSPSGAFADEAGRIWVPDCSKEGELHVIRRDGSLLCSLRDEIFMKSYGVSCFKDQLAVATEQGLVLYMVAKKAGRRIFDN